MYSLIFISFQRLTVPHYWDHSSRDIRRAHDTSPRRPVDGSTVLTVYSGYYIPYSILCQVRVLPHTYIIALLRFNLSNNSCPPLPKEK